MSIDRRNGTEVAMETVKLAEDFMLSSDGLVVGLDLSGDPTVSKTVRGLQRWNGANIYISKENDSFTNCNIKIHFT